MGKVATMYSDKVETVINSGSCYDFVKTVPDKWVVASPAYNIEKRYEKKSSLKEYSNKQEQIVDEYIWTFADDGSICRQIGNFVENSEIVPVDILFVVESNTPPFSRLNLATSTKNELRKYNC
jgi:hypothetical protein